MAILSGASNRIGNKHVDIITGKGYIEDTYHSWNDMKAKEKAKELRSTGEWFACVVPHTQANRRGYFTAYSVYKRAKK